MIDVLRFIQDLEGRYSGHYREAIGDLLVAIARDDRPGVHMARARLERVITETMGIAEVLGATLALRRAAAAVADEPAAFSAWLSRDRRELALFRDTSAQDLLPRVELQEAIDDMASRVPVTLAPAARRVGADIARLYSEGRVVAFTRSAEQSVTERVQALIVQAMREGMGEGQAGSMIRMEVEQIRERTEAWTDAYARNVFRTNVATAVTAGRFRQAQDQDIRLVIPAGRFDAVGDSDTRPNHLAANGRIWSVTHPVWHRLAPPLGFQCRCQFSLVSRPELVRLGRLTPDGLVVEDAVPPGAFPDPGFRHAGRPDLMTA